MSEVSARNRFGFDNAGVMTCSWLSPDRGQSWWRERRSSISPTISLGLRASGVAVRVGQVCAPRTRCGQRRRPAGRVDAPGHRFGVDVHHRWRGPRLLRRPDAVTTISVCGWTLRAGSSERRRCGIHRRSLSREWSCIGKRTPGRRLIPLVSTTTENSHRGTSEFFPAALVGFAPRADTLADHASPPGRPARTARSAAHLERRRFVGIDRIA